MVKHYQMHIEDWKDAMDSHVGDFELKGFFVELIHLIYLYDGSLPDDDKANSYRLYTNIRKFRSLKQKLVLAGLIEVRDGFVVNSGCEKELKVIRTRSEAASKAIRKRHENKNKSLKNNNSNHTTVERSNCDRYTKDNDKDNIDNDDKSSSSISRNFVVDDDKNFSKNVNRIYREYGEIGFDIFGCEIRKISNAGMDMVEIARWNVPEDKVGHVISHIRAILTSMKTQGRDSPSSMKYFRKPVQDVLDGKLDVQVSSESIGEYTARALAEVMQEMQEEAKVNES